MRDVDENNEPNLEEGNIYHRVEMNGKNKSEWDG